MRYTYLKLTNYIGIYNGMGLYEIEIDFSKSIHKVCVIKGTNGSGKSTIMNALSLFPDGNSSFIPDMPASKIIRILYNGITYEIKFYHEIKNGNRETTKAYIATLDAFGNFIEMNPNGNVSQYKELIYKAFKLDSNFAALSRLSMDDRGIGYKRPAERKKFVNSIIESLEVYNDIYKTVSKKVNSLKTLMTSITSKLGNLGDKDTLNDLIKNIESELQSLSDQRDKYISEIATLQSHVDTLDPQGAIQHEYEVATSNLKVVSAQVKKEILNYKSDNRIFIPRFEAELLGKELNSIYDEMTKIKDKITQLLANKSATNNVITDLSRQLGEIQNQISAIKTADYTNVLRKLTDAKNQKETIIQQIECTGIDPNAFTKDEYILALETVHEIVNYVDIFRSTYEYSTINECLSAYKDSGYTALPPVKSTTELDEKIKEYEGNQFKYYQAVSDARQLVELTKTLENRPADCKDDTCYFISSAVEASKKNPQKMLDDATEFYERAKEEYETNKALREQYMDYNNCLMTIHSIVRSIDKNGAILSRLPNGGIFSSKAEFFEYLVGGESFKYIDRMYKYINLANYYEQYHIIEKQIADLEKILTDIEAKSGSISQMESTRDFLQQNIFSNKDKASNYQYQIDGLEDQLTVLETRANVIMNQKIPMCDTIIEHLEQETGFQEQIDKLKDIMKDIQSYTDVIKEKNIEVAKLDTVISLKHKERGDQVYKLNQIIMYEAELNDYKAQSEWLDKIRYYSSPTTGIQLVFMQIYMGKILQISNTLLARLFGGQYQLQPFVINESEFRIPCLGEGYINDDISSMSSSQLTMISMILSFALLYTSSTEYNVIKLDEIDDPLDEPNRAAFALLLDDIMNIMNTEQCIMISHSSEIITENSDIILLRSDGITSISPTSNIIWDFNQ